jgi:6-pyruvoyltetrahydropterin/6-carboxytetrahydropterin synthase
MTRNIIVKTSFASAHYLPDYEGDCRNLHGHTWRVELFIRGDELNEIGMIQDFKELKATVKEILPDHKMLNDYVERPTAENEISWQRYIKDCYELKKKITGQFDEIADCNILYRLPIALSKNYKRRLLIIDDLIDTGNTLLPYREKSSVKIAVLYVKQHAPFMPDYYIKRIPNEWVLFPYEDGR